MAKGKASNPADAYRKAQRKKELKKNKAERAKTRDFVLVKKDTRDLEDEIEKLESSSELSASDKARLKDIKTELENILKKKEEYVAEHPEHRRLVFKSRRPAESRDDKKDETSAPKKRNLFRKNGLPRHPERSIYYDPVMNPFGVPPPGLPYVERALLPNEAGSEAEESEDDDDIVMPEGPPPVDRESIDSDDEIPMPEGPPPPKPGNEQAPLPPLSLGPAPVISPPPFGHSFVPPPPPGMPPLPVGIPGVPPPPPGIPVISPPYGVSHPPPPPPGFPMNALPPPGFPQLLGSTFPPPPAGFPPFPPTNMQLLMPAPPPGFYPRRSNTGAVQDPLSSIPHQTYQAHRAAKSSLPHDPSLPSKPTSGGVRLSTAGSPPLPSTSAVISAEPELRDFKKEATAFVPAALKRKKAGGGSKVNAAPTVGPADGTAESEAALAARPDLLSALQDKLGAPPAKKAKVETEEVSAKPKDDYEKFLEGMNDILGTK